MTSQGSELTNPEIWTAHESDQVSRVNGMKDKKRRGTALNYEFKDKIIKCNIQNLIRS